jgi:hypothetical protein
MLNNRPSDIHTMVTVGMTEVTFAKQPNQSAPTTLLICVGNPVDNCLTHHWVGLNVYLTNSFNQIRRASQPTLFAFMLTGGESTLTVVDSVVKILLVALYQAAILFGTLPRFSPSNQMEIGHFIILPKSAIS